MVLFASFLKKALILSFYILLLLIVACSSDSNEDATSNSENSTENVMVTKVNEIETLFDAEKFDDPKKVELLKELQICSEKSKGPEDYLNPGCSPRFFNVLPFKEGASLENAFLLQIKSKTNGFPLRRLLVFIRENGTLVKVNGFVANLIGTRKSAGAHDDLYLRFNDKDQGEDVFYNCWYQWDGTHYKFLNVEVIEGSNWGGPVKANLKDSISKEVEKDILANKMVF